MSGRNDMKPLLDLSPELRARFTARPLLRLVALATLALPLAFVACKKPDATDPNADKVLGSLDGVVATCANAEGEVEVRRGGEAFWQPIGAGGIFRAGDWVRTKKGAFARIAFRSGAGLELEEDSVVVIDIAPSEDGKGDEAVVAIESGVVRGRTGGMDGGVASPLVLRGKDGQKVRLTQVEGSETPATYRLSAGPEGTEVAVTTGEVQLASLGGKKQALGAGQAAEIGGEKALEVIELIDFPASLEPGIDARFYFARGLQIPLAWRAVEGAKSYRVQVARDLSFQRLELNTELSDTRFTFIPPKEGLYAWRIASKDANGRFGEFGFVRRIFAEKELPQELLLAPETGAEISYSEVAPKVTFAWQSAASAQRYRIVLAKSADLFRTTVSSEATSEQSLTFSAVQPGTYYWGVFIEREGLLAPIFLEPRRLTVKRVPKATVTTPDKIDRWGG